MPTWAAAQFGLVTRPQALAAGMTSEAVDWRVGSGRWVAAGRGVYLTAPGRSGWEVTATAAFLAVQSTGGAVDVALAASSAAFVHGLVPRAPQLVELVVPHRRRVVAPDGVRVRRVARFEDRLDETGYPWRTAPTVTLVDCTSTLDLDGSLALLSRAVQQRRTTAAAIASEIRRRRAHPNSALLLEALTDIGDGAHSAAEVRFVRDVERAHGLPVGQRQVAGARGPARVHDTVYEDHATVVEVDGRLAHEGWTARIGDGRRDRHAAGDGLFTTRVFWPDVGVTPCETAVELGVVLRARGWTGSPRACRRRRCAVRAAVLDGRFDRGVAR